jgi:tripartite-type tricarboxylate transporter receptor subunit TctC
MVDILAQAGAKRDHRIPDVPLLTELTKSEEDREIMALISSPAGVGHPYLAPPGVPGDRLAILRAAFISALKDKDFLVEAAKLQLEIDPMDASEVTAIVSETIGTPPAVVAKAKIAMGQTEDGEKGK